mmetsp:Transcript_146906/g.469427  ORF Transcript_146906/g.469427 Transcript_146906/m.469427 type:complete len:137 (-) Transcript_146906:16-426(-)
MEHRVNAEEVFWASVVSNIPGFSETIEESLVWRVFSGSDDWREAKHSPDNIVDVRLHTYMAEIKRDWPDRFFIRKVVMGRSDDLLRWLDATIERERRYYEHPPGDLSPADITKHVPGWIHPSHFGRVWPNHTSGDF